MPSLSKKEASILFVGDIFIFIFSLWLSLYLRYFELPSSATFFEHLSPFSLLFILWVIIFFISGLYEKHTLVLKSKLPSIIFNAQVVNSIFAIIFFYSVPYFGITPKTTLFIYLVISFCFILAWRLYGIALIGARGRQPALLIGSGEEMRELMNEVNGNDRYGISFVSSIDVREISAIDLQQEIITPIYSNEIKIVAIDFSHQQVAPLLPHLYNLIFSKVRFIDSHKVYEDIFDRIPLSLVTYSWFLENISTAPKFTYDFLKRVFDIVLSFFLGLFSLIFYPFVFIAIKLDDGGPIFISQQRIGKDNHVIRLYKFRSMTSNIEDLRSESNRLNKITRVGSVLRKTRIDELPQLWNVLRGDISLIGPRPELPSGVKKYEEEIPFYNVRHLIKPGLSGWAQIYHKHHPHHGLGTEETKEKLSYDLYYIKNRSFWLDLKIALKTIRELVSRGGA